MAHIVANYPGLAVTDTEAVLATLIADTVQKMGIPVTKISRKMSIQAIIHVLVEAGCSYERLEQLMQAHTSFVNESGIRQEYLPHSIAFDETSGLACLLQQREDKKYPGGSFGKFKLAFVLGQPFGAQQIIGVKILENQRATSVAKEASFMSRMAHLIGTLKRACVDLFGQILNKDYLFQVVLPGQDGETLVEFPLIALQEGEEIEFIRSLFGNLLQLQAAGILHRDIKPSNIMVDPEHGQSFMFDFGLSLSGDEPPNNSPFYCGTVSFSSVQYLHSAIVKDAYNFEFKDDLLATVYSALNMLGLEDEKIQPWIQYNNGMTKALDFAGMSDDNAIETQSVFRDWDSILSFIASCPRIPDCYRELMRRVVRSEMPDSSRLYYEPGLTLDEFCEELHEIFELAVVKEKSTLHQESIQQLHPVLRPTEPPEPPSAAMAAVGVADTAMDTTDNDYGLQLSGQSGGFLPAFDHCAAPQGLLAPSMAPVHEHPQRVSPLFR